MHARESDGLAHHGDGDLVPGLVDLAVNVRSSGTPSWLAARIREADLAAYPDQRAAVAAVAARHRRAADEVLLTAGAAEAFVLLARALRPRHAVVVHPQFTEPEAALRAAGHQVDQLILPFPFALDPTLIPADADLVFVGNPTNPTSVAHPRDVLLQLVRPGRIVVVDEAFADCLPGEPESVAGQAELDGLVVIRSLTKTWALAGLRVGYLLAAPDVVRLLSAAQPRGRSPHPRWRRASPPRPRPPPARPRSGRVVSRPSGLTCLAGWQASTACEWWRPRRRRSCCLTPGSATCGPGCTATGSPSAAVRRSPGCGRGGSASPSATPRPPTVSAPRCGR
jgi:hypothetical protein